METSNLTSSERQMDRVTYGFSSCMAGFIFQARVGTIKYPQINFQATLRSIFGNLSLKPNKIQVKQVAY